MGYFPLCIDLKHKTCVVVGGGTIAFRKIEILMQFDPRIIVIAPAFSKETEEFLNVHPSVSVIHRAFQDHDIVQADLVVAATDNITVNTHISKLCMEQKILVNVVDVPEECTFIFPAMVKRDNLVIAVSTGGNSPLMAARIKKEIEEVIPDYYGALIELLGEYRDIIKRKIHLPEYRVRIYNELIDTAKHHGNNLTPDMIDKVIDQYSKE